MPRILKTAHGGRRHCAADSRQLKQRLRPHAGEPPGRGPAGHGQWSPWPAIWAKSVTDACIGWEATVAVLEQLADAVRQRRAGARG